MARRSRAHRVVDLPQIVVVRRRVPSSFSIIEDRRLFHPLGDFRPARSFLARPRPRLVIADVNVNRGRRKVTPYKVPSQIGFSVPRDVVVCVRRKQRKEVLHAFKFTGRGSGSGRKRRNYWSDVSC